MVKEIIGLSCMYGSGKGGTIPMLGGYTEWTCLFRQLIVITFCLARVALVNRQGEVLYDAYVQQASPVENHRTAATGT